MTRIVLLALAALLMPATAWPQTGEDGPLGPITVARPDGGPAVAVRPSTAAPIVAIRLAIPVREPADAIGATRVLQRLASRRAETAAAEHGARVSMQRLPTHAVYVLVGPADGFDDYVRILRQAVVRPPDVTPRDLVGLTAKTRAEAMAELDTPGPLLRHRLRAALLPAGATIPEDSAAGSLTPRTLLRFWRNTFVPSRMQAVVVGAIDPERALRAFDGWPSPASAGGEPPATPEAAGESAPPDPQALFPWVGLGYAADEDADPAALAVAARLVQQRLDESFLRTARAEMWWPSDGRHALVLIGSASPREARAFVGSRTPSETDDGAAGAAPADTADAAPADTAEDAVEPFRIGHQLRLALSRTAALLEPEAVANARRLLRRDLLFTARTPQGMARVLGEFMQRTGDARSAVRFLDAVGATTAGAVHRELVSLLSSTPVRAEVVP